MPPRKSKRTRGSAKAEAAEKDVSTSARPAAATAATATGTKRGRSKSPVKKADGKAAAAAAAASAAPAPAQKKAKGGRGGKRKQAANDDMAAAAAAAGAADAAPSPGSTNGKSSGTGGQPSKKKTRKEPGAATAPTVAQILGDELTQLSLTHWAGDAVSPFSLDLVSRVYKEQVRDRIGDEAAVRSRVRLLELSQFLEKYLWPAFADAAAAAKPADADGVLAATMAVVVLINEKFRQDVNPWRFLDEDGAADLAASDRRLDAFLDSVFTLAADRLSAAEREWRAAFLVNCFRSMENARLRSRLLKLVSLPCWLRVTKARVHRELESLPAQLSKHWRALQKKLAKAQKAGADSSPLLGAQSSFFADELRSFLGAVHVLGAGGAPDSAALGQYVERMLELLVDLLSQLPTRRFLWLLVDDTRVVEKCRLSSLYQSSEARERARDSAIAVAAVGAGVVAASDGGEAHDLGLRLPLGEAAAAAADAASKDSHAARGRSGESHSLFVQLVDLLEFYMHFDVDLFTGAPLSLAEASAAHYARVQELQRAAFTDDRRDQGRALAMAAAGSVDTRANLIPLLEPFSNVQLHQLCADLCLMDPPSPDATADRALLEELLVQRVQRRESAVRRVAGLPLFPSETDLWNEAQLPDSLDVDGGRAAGPCLALPKLNLQFLTFSDYLRRNFELYRLGAAHDIRLDLEDALARAQPRTASRAAGRAAGSVVFRRWTRMASPLLAVKLLDVSRAPVGEIHPGRVLAEVRLTLAGMPTHVRAEWDALRPHDALFFLAMNPPRSVDDDEDDAAKAAGTQSSVSASAAERAAARADTLASAEAAGARKRFGIEMVRGAELLDLCDAQGKSLLEDRRGGAAPPTAARVSGAMGDERVLKVLFDAAQYQLDVDERAAAAGSGVTAAAARVAGADAVEAAYRGFHLVVRRRPKENNFRAVLDTLRGLLAERLTAPTWLRDVCLGYGNPDDAVPPTFTDLVASDRAEAAGDVADLDAAAGLKARAEQDARAGLDFFDTFLDGAHVVETHPGTIVKFYDATGSSIAAAEATPPFRLTVEPNGKTKKGGVIRVDSYQEDGAAENATAEVRRLHGRDFGTRRNRVRFTERQTAAIERAMGGGLTMVVGPPGTGKTDTAVQIVANLYRQRPNERILLVTHSNQALNQLFDKLVHLAIDERHLLRLGHGEDQLETTKDFSKYGRVNYMLSRRLGLLSRASHLCASLQLPEWSSELETCQQAILFFEQQVVPRWKKFEADVTAAAEAAGGASAAVADQCAAAFPFTSYFADLASLGGVDDAGDGQGDADMAAPAVSKSDAGHGPPRDLPTARALFTELSIMFGELEECMAFELLRSGRDRSNFLATRQARIVAMTCTHAAMRRQELVDLGFRYHTLVMEEAAQVLEIETFVPLLLQKSQGTDGLRRVVLIGDHNQLPPVVKNPALRAFARFDQSLFGRLVRLGVPTVQLDMQGRARPSLAALYSWRYTGLGNLPAVCAPAPSPYARANGGLAHVCQLIDVPDYGGQGESEPTPHFVQNLGEAEYAAALFTYLRLRGHPANRIAVLATYNGQKHLLRDVFQARCGADPRLGMPSKITTVDRYQGQQNDIVLLSLVRSKIVGHVRDVRRLVVAMSRARLGLYVFCRKSLFQNCYELTNTFRHLLALPDKLQLVQGERYGTERAWDAKPTDVKEIKDVVELGQMVASELYGQTQQ